VEYLTLCAQNPGRVAISLHEYSLDNDIRHAEGWLIGRFHFLFEAADAARLKRPTVFITECGWTLNSGPADLMADVRYLADLYSQHPQIAAAFLWTLQAGKGNGDLPQRLNGILPALTEYTLHTRFSDPTSPPPPEPPAPPEKYKATYILIPPTANDRQAAAIWSFQRQKRRTVGHSPEDAIATMPPHNPLARADSEIVAYNFKDWHAAARQKLLQYNVRGTPMPADGVEPEPPPPPPPNGVLSGLRLGHLFAYRYALTSAFNAARDYGNKLHEGADYDLVGGAADNKATCSAFMMAW
jgi:hypothetical protein